MVVGCISTVGLHCLAVGDMWKIRVEIVRMTVEMIEGCLVPCVLYADIDVE
jgi:hypothetical protein